MFGGKKKSQGIKLIDEVIGRFGPMIEELTVGIADCRSEQAHDGDQIELYTAHKAILDSSVNRAETIISNLRKLIGE